MAIPVPIAAVLLTAVTAVLLFADVSGRARTALIVVDILLRAFFFVDYLVRFTLAIPKKRLLREEWVDGVCSCACLSSSHSGLRALCSELPG